MTIRENQMITPHQAESAAEIAVKAAPPVTVTAASIFGYPVSNVLLWLTLIYTVMMIIHKAWTLYRAFFGKRVEVVEED